MAKLTTEDFIRKAREVHGEKYDYSKVEYIGSLDKVIIICPKHGEFLQVPTEHLRGRGCKKCGTESYKVSLNEFIERAKEIHGNKYDYSKVNYVNGKIKVIIICPEHGEFEQQPNNHINVGQGCPKCACDRNRLTINEFIERAKEIHDNKYDYSKINYVDSKTKVVVICSKHGEFEQTPNSHLQGQGCDKCGGTAKLNTSEFIERAKEIHGDKYDYSKVNYVDNKTPVIITCPEHGEIKQIPNSHLQGHGCLKCGANERGLARLFTTEEFIERAKEIHGDKYDYSKVNYVDSKTNVIIVCPKHGEFLQEANSHLQGRGCAKCTNTFRLNTIDFIEKAKEIHGDKYDYSKVNYVSNRKEVIIICPEHGEFKQKPHGHLRGHGCSICVGKTALTTETFIKKAREVHGNKYGYSKVNYINTTSKVIIICPEHGEFEQIGSNHLNGCDCPKCTGNYKRTQEEFIQEAKKVHNNKYDYSKVNHIDGKTKVIIICPEHGEFEQNPRHHLEGFGCRRCSGFGFTYMSLDDVKKIIKQQNIKSMIEFNEWWKNNEKYCRKMGIPRNPDLYYRTHK